MLPLHQMLFNVVHKILLPRKQKRTEACYLDLTLMDLLLSRTQINLSVLIMSHIHSLSKLDKKKRGLAYGFWLGQVFEHFGVPVKKWQIQIISDVMGKVDYMNMPGTPKRVDVKTQRLRASLTAVEEEMEALKKAHSVEMEQIQIAHKLEREELIAENCRIKEELTQTQAALHQERDVNSGHLQSIMGLLTKGSSNSSTSMAPSV